MRTVVTKKDRALAARFILGGGLCAVPTETVYGLAANGLSEDAVMKLYEVKGRPETKPISLLITGIKQAESFCGNIPEDAYALADAFWPGPLTMVLEKSGAVPDIVTAGLGTVGVRCPRHDDTLGIIELCGVPLAAPSANVSDMKSPVCAKDVLGYFDGKIECVFDGGPCSVGVESTIVDMTERPYRILRQGGLERETILAVLGEGSLK
ncbi:MAG: threonylcarbamoyl-AMP synthase [Clostridia bacterium]|nr:threonylcarbamoyl-AMP synthase [Clostridia bacterium]